MKIAQEKLKERNEQALAIRYDLKRALMELGPSGYPFEKLISDLLRKFGYRTKTNLTLQGKCVSHEIDVIAEKDGKKIHG